MPLVVTLLVILIGFTGLIVYDVYLAAQGGYENTISYLCLQAARREPLLPLVVGLVLGLLLGHLFWPQFEGR
jgi:hypothetical protein